MANFPRFLLIDSYDSFTYNLASLIHRSIAGSHIHIIRNDEISIVDLLPLLHCFDAVVIGPGPGSPCNPQDVGVINDLWKLADEYRLPIFGVCLGFQSLAINFGYVLDRLTVVKHGQLSDLIHRSEDIFCNVGTVQVVRYHSLYVKPSCSGDSPIKSLAWAIDDDANGEVLMGIRHGSKPFWAVQYHPESICTSGGMTLLQNFWQVAQRWNNDERRDCVITSLPRCIGSSWPPQRVMASTSLAPNMEGEKLFTVATRCLECLVLTATDICEKLRTPDERHCILLDSAASPGRFSIVACSLDCAEHITHSAGSSSVFRTIGVEKPRHEDLNGLNIWLWLRLFMEERMATGGCSDIPFWGGLIGFISFAAGLKTLSPHHSVAADKQDVSLIFVKRSIVLDRVTGHVYIQSLVPHDELWIENVSNVLGATTPVDTPCDIICDEDSRIDMLKLLPKSDESAYITKIYRALQHLAVGNSYEICLTSQTQFKLPALSAQDGHSRSWNIYKRLRKANAAPFASFMRIGGTTLLSSSPERFMRFSREGEYQMRPIKGTVSKTICPERSDAVNTLSSPKEFAENLMIVDLIRHDLHLALGEEVSVAQLCAVEEYQTLWQLVSTIEGRGMRGQGPTVLGACLPPGSMTGAPKKRTCEILDELETSRRGLYSGVCGYFDVGGGGDFSVVIRSCVVEQPEVPADSEHELWSIGAGGAITALSDPKSEWEEMRTKLDCVLAAFRAASRCESC